jgi:hypothetical protein
MQEGSQSPSHDAMVVRHDHSKDAVRTGLAARLRALPRFDARSVHVASVPLPGRDT